MIQVDKILEILVRNVLEPDGKKRARLRDEMHGLARSFAGALNQRDEEPFALAVCSLVINGDEISS